MRKIGFILVVLLLLIGIGILVYPVVSQWWSDKKQSEVIADYNNGMDEIDNENAKRELRRAKEYNDDLADTAIVTDPFLEEDIIDTSSYDTILNFAAEGVMGYVEIPKIDVLLPIYHGVGTDVLGKGVGHLPETSLPVGGESTHAVLAGHSGMSNARLFTDLPDLELGDIFYIHVYNKTMTYTVDQIKTVSPTDTSDLNIVEGKDYVTLVTCVPITVNSHRLLVRGVRTN